MSSKKFKILMIALVVAAALFYFSPVNRVGTVADFFDIESSRDNTFGIGEVIVTAVSPNGGETWSVGSTYPITWTSDPSPPDWASEVDIWLSKDSGSTWPSLIVDSTENDGSYSWTPSSADVSDNCRIRVVARGEGSWTGKDMSDSDFAIS